MRIILAAAAALLALAPAQAFAQQWYRVGGNEKTTTYADLASLRPLGDKIIAVTRSVYAVPLDGDVYSSAIRSEYDCAGKYFRTLEYSYYDGNGKLMSTEPSQTINERKTPAVNSINEALMDFVCYRKGGTPVGEVMSDARAQFGKY